MYNVCKKCNNWILAAAILIVLLSGQLSWADDAAESLHVQIGDKVIYCSAQLNVNADQLRLPMRDGITVATTWHLKIGKVREYWLNESIGEITVMRRVEPDLLSHSWLLIDVSSGISHRVYQLKQAIDFLAGLNHFPVLDRSLLLPDKRYRAVVKIEIHIGDTNNAWWAGLWPSTADSMQTEFELP